MGFNKTVEFRSGFQSPAFRQGTAGLNILIVSELPATGNSGYLYLVPDVNHYYRGIPVMTMFMYQNSQWVCLSMAHVLDTHGGTASQAASTYYQTTYLDAAHLLNQKEKALENVKANPDATAEQIAAAEAELATAKAAYTTCRTEYAALRKAAHAEYLANVTAKKNAVKNITSYEGKYDNYEVNDNVDDFENGMF